MQNTLAKQRKCRTPIHRAFDEFQLGDLSFYLPIPFLSGESRFHSRSITLNALDKLVKLSDGTGSGFGSANERVRALMTQRTENACSFAGVALLEKTGGSKSSGTCLNKAT
jgi:hypothetical protein